MTVKIALCSFNMLKFFFIFSLCMSGFCLGSRFKPCISVIDINDKSFIVRNILSHFGLLRDLNMMAQHILHHFVMFIYLFSFSEHSQVFDTKMFLVWFSTL